MTKYEQHQKECNHYGITPLTYDEYNLCIMRGVPEDDLYSLASDLYCDAFETIFYAIGYYMKVRK